MPVKKGDADLSTLAMLRKRDPVDVGSTLWDLSDDELGTVLGHCIVTGAASSAATAASRIGT